MDAELFRNTVALIGFGAGAVVMVMFGMKENAWRRFIAFSIGSFFFAAFLFACFTMAQKYAERGTAEILLPKDREIVSGRLIRTHSVVQREKTLLEI